MFIRKGGEIGFSTSLREKNIDLKIPPYFKDSRKFWIS